MEEKESHRNQLAPPPTKYPKIHEELTTNNRHRKRSSKCLVYILLAVFLQSIAILVFGFVVLHTKSPSLRLSSAALTDLRYESASLNMTVVAGIRINNMNFGDFEFRSGGSASFLYGNANIGSASIGGGRVGRRERREMNVAVKVEVIGGGGVLSSENYVNFSRDLGLGFVKLSLAELRGVVRVVKTVKRRRTAFMNCTMGLNLTSQLIQELSCQ